MTHGVCRNSSCSNSASQTSIELYPGPGEYCPECGERLDPLAAPAAPSEPPAPSAPFGGLTALQALQQFGGDESPAADAPDRARPRLKRSVVASSAVTAAAIAAIFIFHPGAVGHPASSDIVHVCRSSMSDRVAGDLVRAYAEKTRTPVARFELSRSSPCDVRFAASANANPSQVVGSDGIVVIVNPANGITHLDEDTLRRIFRGDIRDWSQAGGSPGPIVVMLPEDGSDETTAPMRELFRGVRLSPNVKRLPTSADVTRAVVRADSRGAIGLVAFSEAVPARVLALGNSPLPSPLSIGDHRYPLSLSVSVSAEPSAHSPAAALTEFALSDEAQAIVSRSGLVPKKGV